MNKQGPKGIGWCDFTWNVVSGCWGPGGTAEKPNRCSYCYAQGIAKRFAPKKDYGDGWREKDAEPFAPTFHPYRLSEPAKVKKPSKIFVCSMADLFGDWVPRGWIGHILNIVRNCPQHTFQFLTKNPKRLKDFNPWPRNAWVGTTVTNQDDMDDRGHWLRKVDASVKFVSHEPLLGPIDLGPIDWGFQWAIIGAQTGPGAVKLRIRKWEGTQVYEPIASRRIITPEPEWVMNLAQQYRDAAVPLFLKDNLGFKDQPQEWPILEGL